MATVDGKARNFAGIGYPENMLENWKEEIGDKFQGIPYAYCVHDRGFDTDGDARKTHVHILIHLNNTTTPNAALQIFRTLNADGKNAFSTVQSVFNIRGAYDYLIHDTETAQKAGKELYDPSERITGNNFDIGVYEQIDTAEKEEIVRELTGLVIDGGYCNFTELTADVLRNLDEIHFKVLKENSAFFERLTKGNFQMLFKKPNE